MTHDEMIAVIQAHKEGKQIEYRTINPESPWVYVKNPKWDFPQIEYRVKPEPRTFWLVSTPAGAHFGYTNYTEAKDVRAACQGTLIQVQEVL